MLSIYLSIYYHLARIVSCRAVSGCCVATTLLACLGLSIAWEPVPLGGNWGEPLGGGDGADTAAVLPGLKRGVPATLQNHLHLTSSRRLVRLASIHFAPKCIHSSSITTFWVHFPKALFSGVVCVTGPY